MTIKQAIILALMQGATEFLPISSSGHLVLTRSFLGISNIPILFDLILHLGTVSATIIVYYKTIGDIFKDIGIWMFCIKTEKKRNIQEGNVKLFFFILISAVVTGIIGFLFKRRIIDLFYNTSMVSILLFVTGLILIITRFIEEGGKGIDEISIPVPMIIGATQAFSMLPGISRSGCTISAGLIMGMNREFAGLYSFLLSIPSVIGASVFEYIRSSQYLYEQVSVPVMVTAFFLSLIAGYAALNILLRFLKRGKLYIFSFYCFCAGAVGLIL
ncbi:MAG: undecaprenyl-diphosphate phosphatase [Spirochaetota bacterium]|nr:MAG: undecaprenyl-diphosphate phosphatase [Spirochaetota bacterium]